MSLLHNLKKSKQKHGALKLKPRLAGKVYKNKRMRTLRYNNKEESIQFDTLKPCLPLNLTAKSMSTTSVDSSKLIRTKFDTFLSTLPCADFFNDFDIT